MVKDVDSSSLNAGAGFVFDLHQVTGVVGGTHISTIVRLANSN